MGRANKACPCGSDNKYRDCCQRLHNGSPAENALALMRSRYVAYAFELADYIMDTTHPSHPSYTDDRKAWKDDILAFSRTARFERLEILDFQDGEKEAFVTFIAHISQDTNDLSFQERSRFVKVDGQWLYIDGEVKDRS